jgi:iron complex outermembrane receptor protein
VSWKAGLDYDLTDQTLSYLTVTTGFKSGGLNPGIDTVPSFKPEQVRNYELGVKSRLNDDQVAVNLALFYESYTNLQVTQLTNNGGSLGQVTENAAKASIHGVETEGQWQMTRRDRLGGFFNYLKATYSDYNDAVDQQTGIVYPSLSGHYLPHAPKFSVKLQYSHEFLLPNGATLTPAVSSYYQTTTYLREFNLPIDHVGGYANSALTLKYVDATGHWKVDAYGDNLENRTVRNSGFTVVGHYFSDYNPPRTFGARVSCNWGG